MIVDISDAYSKNPNDSNNSTSSIIVRSLYYPPTHRLHMRIGSGIRLSRLGRGVTAVTRVTHCHNTGHRSHTGHTIHWSHNTLVTLSLYTGAVNVYVGSKWILNCESDSLYLGTRRGP